MSERKNNDRAREVEQNLLDISRLTDEQLFEKFGTEPDGLNQVEAAERLEEYGPNIIDVSNETSLLSRIKDAVVNPFNIVLMIVALVTLFTDVILSDAPNPATFIMLVLIIVISGVISYVQSAKSDNAAKKLQKMIANRIDVIRN